jgi:hypothetical protein
MRVPSPLWEMRIGMKAFMNLPRIIICWLPGSIKAFMIVLAWGKHITTSERFIRSLHEV